MRKSKSKTYTVIGTRPFPIDMLRYDAAWPASEEDSHKIGHTFEWDQRGDRQEITLRTNYEFAPEEPRWRSFGWQVKP